MMKKNIISLVIGGFLGLTTFCSCEGATDDSIYEDIREPIPIPIDIDEQPLDRNSTGDDNDVEPKREDGDA